MKISKTSFLTPPTYCPSWCGRQSPGFLFLASTVTENWPVKVVCRTATIPTMLLQLIWEIRFKNLIQEKQKSWAFNFRASCNSWAASPLSLSIFWAKKEEEKNLLGLWAFCPEPKENFLLFAQKMLSLALHDRLLRKGLA